MIRIGPNRPLLVQRESSMASQARPRTAPRRPEERLDRCEHQSIRSRSDKIDLASVRLLFLVIKLGSSAFHVELHRRRYDELLGL